MNTLRVILQEILDGTTIFRPKSSSELDMRNFQSIAEALAYANRQGFLEDFEPHKENETGNRWYSMIRVIDRLSPKGKQFLAVPDSNIDANP